MKFHFNELHHYQNGFFFCYVFGKFISMTPNGNSSFFCESVPVETEISSPVVQML